MQAFQQWPKIDNYHLRANEAHLWQIELPLAHMNARFKALAKTKEERLKILRHILGLYIGNDDFKIIQNAKGKPKLANDALEFNLSHSNNKMLLALTHLPLGIDLEFMKKRDIEQFSLRFWGHDFYQKEIDALPWHFRTIAFYTAWTQTEAWVKAHGQTIFQFDDWSPKNLLQRSFSSPSNHLFVSFMPWANFMATLCLPSSTQIIYHQKLTAADILAIIHDTQ